MGLERYAVKRRIYLQVAGGDTPGVHRVGENNFMVAISKEI